MSTEPGGQPVATPGEQPTESKRVLVGVLAILLGGLGVHKFVLGLTVPGIIMLIVSLITAPVTCGAGYGIMGTVGLIEGIIYLTKSDEEFHRIYEVEKKAWF